MVPHAEGGFHSPPGRAAPAAPEPALQPTVPMPMPEPAAPRPADPVRLAKLTHFAQRIVQTAEAILPPEHHEMLDQLLARVNHQLAQGEGPEAVKNLALAVSRGAVEAGCDGELVRLLNSNLKALFSK